jgi:predicted SprT family Zn-dependent metalloprotease
MHLRFNPDKILQELPAGSEGEFYLEELVVHELCHIYTYRVWQLTERFVAHYISDRDHKLWADLLTEMHEETTTALGMSFTQLGRSLEGK